MIRFHILVLALVMPLTGACTHSDTDEGAVSAGGESLGSTADADARAARQLAHLTARLELSDEQVEALQPVLREIHQERAALRELPRGERREAALDLRDRTHEAFEGVLSPEQMDSLREMRAERWGRRGPRGRRGPGGYGPGGGGPGGFGPGGPPSPERMLERMTRHLDLTDAQVEEVRPLVERAHERRTAIRDLPLEERREEAQAIREEMHDALSEVLTEAQRARLEAHFEQRRGRGHGRFGGRGPGPHGPGPQGRGPGGPPEP